MVKVESNIEKQLRHSVRDKVGYNHESFIYFIYMNLPSRVCSNGNILGHVHENYALRLNRPLEEIYDERQEDILEEESQRWENDFKVLFDDQIDYAYLSNSSSSSVFFLFSPIFILISPKLVDKYEFLDMLYGPDPMDSNILGGYSVHTGPSLDGHDSDLDEFPKCFLRKRSFAELTPVSPI
ncbi:hypothetical protein MKX01_028945 [Papaver californicum]|nr:hypothetical protein MKX01_028945 [Papaver californicum]